MWLLAAGLHQINPTRGPHFTMENMAVQAAIDGQGVALIGDVLVADDNYRGPSCAPLRSESQYTVEIFLLFTECKK